METVRRKEWVLQENNSLETENMAVIFSEIETGCGQRLAVAGHESAQSESSDNYISAGKSGKLFLKVLDP